MSDTRSAGSGQQAHVSRHQDTGAPSLAAARLALLLAGVLWSLGGIFIKTFFAGLPAVAPLTVGGVTLYRSLFAGLALAPSLPRLRFALREQPAALIRDLAVGMAVYVTLLGTYVASMRGTTAANAIILQYTAPLYAIALSPLVLREGWRRADLATLAIAVPGIAILIAGSFASAAKTALLLGATSGFCFGFFLLWLRRLRAVDPLAMTSLNNLGTALFFTVLLVTERNPDLGLPDRALHGFRPAAVTLGLLIAMGCLQIAAPYSLLSFGLRRVRSAEASLITLVEPVLSPLWVFLILGERPASATLAGGSMILFALTLRYTLFAGRASRSST